MNRNQIAKALFEVVGIISAFGVGYSGAVFFFEDIFAVFYLVAFVCTLAFSTAMGETLK